MWPKHPGNVFFCVCSARIGICISYIYNTRFVSRSRAAVAGFHCQFIAAGRTAVTVGECRALVTRLCMVFEPKTGEKKSNLNANA